MDKSGQHVLIGFADSTAIICHVFSGEVLITLKPPLPLLNLKTNGEIVHILHTKLKGNKETIIAATSTGTIISWNLGSGIENTSGIIIGLVAVNPTPCTSVLVHNSMITNMTIQTSDRNLLGISTLDGRILILNADRVGKALINSQILNNALCTSMIFLNYVYFCGHSNGILSCHSIKSDGLKLFDINILLDLKSISMNQEKGLSYCNSIQENAPTSIKHLTLTSDNLLVCTIGHCVRVFDISTFPKNHLPTKDIDWLNCLVPVISFYIPALDSDEIESFIFDDDEGKNSGLLYIGGQRKVQVWTINGKCLGQFGDRCTWLVDDPNTWKNQKPIKVIDIDETINVWRDKKNDATFIKNGECNDGGNDGGKDGGNDGGNNFTNNSSKILEKNPHAQPEEQKLKLKPERSKNLTWNLELRKNRRKVKGFNVGVVSKTANLVKEGTKRRLYEAKEWAESAFGKK